MSDHPWYRMGKAMRDHLRKMWAGRQFGYVSNLDDGMYGADPEHLHVMLSTEQHNVITSRVNGDLIHMPALDIDHPVYVVPSSTPGHHHLFINVPMTWGDYHYLLNALAKVGIIEEGYANASIEKEMTAVRLPWVKKK